MRLALTLLLLCPLASGEPYAWPLNVSPELTSSFAEYRPGRFHAGIDLRTGDIGKPVFAPEEGYISRVRCSPDGYGKAVYIQFKDGRNVVFGHLDDYEDVVRAYVRAAQHAGKTYTVDLYPEAGQFPVTRGQIIAKSGQTGIGAPHLHYELRDAQQKPINPRSLDIAWPDTRKPILRKVLIAPSGPEDTVNGDLVPVILEARAAGEGRYVCDSIRTGGRIGIGVDVIDPGTGGAKLGVYRLRLLRGDEELFCVQHDVLSYDNLRNGAVAYHPYLLNKGNFLLLWRWPGNVCPSYAKSPGTGWVDAPVEPGELRVEATDFLGNTSVLTIPVRPEKANVLKVADGVPGKGVAELDCDGQSLIVTVRFTAPEAELPEVLVDAGGTAVPVGVRQVSDRLFRAAFAPTLDGAYRVRVSHPRMAPFEREVQTFARGAKERRAAFGEAQLTAASNSPYGALFAWKESPEKLPQTPVRQCGEAYTIAPGEAPIDEPVTISLPMPEGIAHAERVHIYRKYGTVWVCLSTRREGGRLITSGRNLGTFMALEDDTPPAVSNVSPANGYQAKTRRPKISASVRDTGSGIAEITVTCGTQWLLTEYDPERNHIEWEEDEDLPSGKQEISIQITDKAGNITTVKRSIVVPG